MNAHQKLTRAIPTARCREIEIAIENRDNRQGLVSLGVLLTDEESSPKRTLYLGQQPVLSTEPRSFLSKNNTDLRDDSFFGAAQCTAAQVQ